MPGAVGIHSSGVASGHRLFVAGFLGSLLLAPMLRRGSKSGRSGIDRRPDRLA